MFEIFADLRHHHLDQKCQRFSSLRKKSFHLYEMHLKLIMLIQAYMSSRERVHVAECK
jgi:hypothetical protein